MNQHTEHDPLAEADRNRARADAAEGLAALRAASLAELAAYAEELRCQVADLTDDAHTLFTDKPYPPDGLRYVTARINRLADTLARAAAGYTSAHAEDMAFPYNLDELTAHGWWALSDHELDGTLPPLPPTELDERRGYRRGWIRDGRTLMLWFTGPHALAYAHSSLRGRLYETAEVYAVITARLGTTEHVAVAPPQPLDASYHQIADHLRAAGWAEPAEIHACDEHGTPRPNGPGVSATWTRPSNPLFELSVWGVGDEPARARYWAGPVNSLAHLARITRHR